VAVAVEAPSAEATEEAPSAEATEEAPSAEATEEAPSAEAPTVDALSDDALDPEADTNEEQG
jgi:hypothetical protein